MGVVRRALGSMDNDPVLVVGEHRLARLEDCDTLPQTRSYALIWFITWKIQYDSDKYKNRMPTLILSYECRDYITIAK